MKKIINEIENPMVTQLTTEQMKVLHNVLCELLPELSTPTSTVLLGKAVKTNRLSYKTNGKIRR
jgi:hypothetical protein